MILILSRTQFLKLFIFLFKIINKCNFYKIRLYIHIWKMNFPKMKAIILLQFLLQEELKTTMCRNIFPMLFQKKIIMSLKRFVLLIWKWFHHFWKILKQNYIKNKWHGKRPLKIIKWHNLKKINKLLLLQFLKKDKTNKTSIKIALIYLIYLTSVKNW